MKHWFVMHAFLSTSALSTDAHERPVNLATTLPSASYIGTSTRQHRALAAFSVNRDLAASYTFAARCAVAAGYVGWRYYLRQLRLATDKVQADRQANRGGLR